jgi:hypothetical protein
MTEDMDGTCNRRGSIKNVNRPSDGKLQGKEHLETYAATEGYR